MKVVIRAATQKDYEAVCALFAQEDQVHAQALHEVFQPFEGPARLWEFFAQILANEEAAIFVAEHQEALVGPGLLLDAEHTCSVCTSPFCLS